MQVCAEEGEAVGEQAMGLQLMERPAHPAPAGALIPKLKWASGLLYIHFKL